MTSGAIDKAGSSIQVGNKLLDLAHNYTGHSFDPVLGQYYAKARMYDAINKRFSAEDLVKGFPTIPATLTPYNYCIGNPLRFIDLDGRIATDSMIPTIDEDAIIPVNPIPPRAQEPQLPAPINQDPWMQTIDDDPIVPPAPPREPVQPPLPEPLPEPEPIDPDAFNTCPIRALDGTSNNYRGVPIVRDTPFAADTSGMGWGRIHLGSAIGIPGIDGTIPQSHINLLQHEFGHHIQYKILGTQVFGSGIAFRSVINYFFDGIHNASTDPNNYNLQIWEVTAEMFGGVPRRVIDEDGNVTSTNRTLEAEIAGLRYMFLLLEISDMFFLIRGLALDRLEITTDTKLMNRVNNFPLPGTGSIAHAINNPPG